MTAPKFTAETAQQFDGFSMTNATIAVMERKCECQPYIDIFTYNRWAAMGYHVRKGEHGTKLTTFASKEYQDKEGNTQYKKLKCGASVFCRCQVDKNE